MADDQTQARPSDNAIVASCHTGSGRKALGALTFAANPEASAILGHDERGDGSRGDLEPTELGWRPLGKASF